MALRNHSKTAPVHENGGAGRTMAPVATARENLSRFAWLSIVAALVTIALKTGAWWMTGSVGLLSDAAESVVNLVAAIVALIALRVAARPADDSHHYGHTKAEYFSAAVEGQMIFIAAVFIIYSAVDRLMHPQPLENVGVGLAVSIVASVVNGAVAFVLIRAGRQHRSLTLTADGKHLLTDVWTSVGVVAGVLLVAVTGLTVLDPIVALLVGANIIVTGWKLLWESGSGLMDAALPTEESRALADVLAQHTTSEVHFHGLRTRTSGHHGYADVHVLVPGDWSVQRSHDLIEEIEHAVSQACPDVTLVAHVEPSEDPRSYDDYPTEVPIERLDP